MTPRQEIVEVRDGTGAIEVRGNRLACGLFVHGKPFVLHWDERSGSICQEVLHNAHVADDAVAMLRRITLQGPEANRSLREQIAPLLSQFASGTYELMLAPLPADTGFVEWHGTQSGYYPDPLNLVATQPDPSISDIRILEYMEMIEGGARPVVLTASVPEAWCEFILDGHHKFCAYGWMKLPAWRLCIKMLDPKLVTLDDWPTRDLPRNFYDNVKPPWKN